MLYTLNKKTTTLIYMTTTLSSNQTSQFITELETAFNRKVEIVRQNELGLVIAVIGKFTQEALVYLTSKNKIKKANNKPVYIWLD